MFEEKINKNESIMKNIGIIFILILLGVLFFFGFKEYQLKKAEKQVESINIILNKNIVSIENCRPILDFDKTLLSENNEFFDDEKYEFFKKDCNMVYDISNVKISENFCTRVIKSNKSDFEKDFIILDGFSNIQNKCTDKYLKVGFSTGSFFDLENNFKSVVNIDFSLDFFEDRDEIDSEGFIKNRIKAKEKLISLLKIEPKIDINIEDIVLYPKKAILNIKIKPETEYVLNMKSFDTKIWKESKKEEFKFKSPEKKFFWFKINKKVSLFADTNSPDFTFYSYNNLKKEAKIKICRIDNESYAKIEVYDSFPNADFRRNFFKTWIDKIKNYECFTKTINLDNNKLDFQKKDFNFDKEIWKLARSWLYVVYFENVDDREYNNRIQKPIFFGIIDSHITMKVSANWEWFFFVNDFNWNALPWQEIRAYLNDFKSQKREYNYEKREYETKYFSPFENNVLSKEILLWKTDKNWILKVDLKDKINGYFDRTMEWWDYSYNWNLNSFFITSASETNLSYVSSKHNGWITAWNFGYSIWSWWYWNRSENVDKIELQRWWEEKEILSHIFTDRKLYLPAEKVEIKAILRKSSDLSIPRWKKVNLVVRDPQWKDLLNTDIKINDFGSINYWLKLTKESILWNYNISLFYDEKNIWNSGFSVEIFKNPKFKNDIMLETVWLNWELVKITDTKVVKDYYREENKYFWDFNIKARVSSKYYNGSSLKDGNFRYKVYKQYYYDNSYWNDCYYGCYWEPEKELYTEWKGTLNNLWIAEFKIPVKFESSYNDYKYIVEVTVEDISWDIISSSNSIIAKLPSEYKRWDSNSWINFKTEKRFYKSGEKIEVNWNLQHWKFTEDYNDKFLLIIKKKEYETKKVLDVRGYNRPVTKSKEIVEKILIVNNKNFILTEDWKIKLNYIAKTSGEYIFEFWKINKNYFFESDKLIKEFQEKLEEEKNKKVNKSDVKLLETKKLVIKKELNKKIKITYDNLRLLTKYCSSEKNLDCTMDYIEEKVFNCEDWYIDESCRNDEINVKMWLEISIDDLIDPDNRKFFTVISYWNKDSTNPIISDNKIQVLSEKISYHIWEKARFLIRLPSSKWKVLLTIEKKWVIKSELIDVNSNIFFKEYLVDDKFAPNAYIWVVFIPSPDSNIIPEYKVWYTEIVIDKTDKKSFIEIKTDKKVYKPRDMVTLDLKVKNANNKTEKSELTVMIVDDSLISLMWNVDLNTLEKFYKKLPFRIQTSITNIAMLQNYYFSRKWIVGWSWFGNFKGWDSVVSSRNIFKNTAYYNANIITDSYWKAQVKFELPDNLTNFRVMVVSNSINNFFGFSEDFIEVRKNVIVEDKTPIILRNWDVSEIWANIFNTTDKDIWFSINLEASNIELDAKTKNIFIKAGSSKFVSWQIIVQKNISKIDYKISALWDSKENSDIIENSIEIKQSPVLITNRIDNVIIPGFNKTVWIWKTEIEIGDNVDIENTKVEVIFSNNKLTWIEEIVWSLAKYPYGCIEQTISSTMPNAILLKFDKIFPWIIKNSEQAKTNLEAGIKRFKSMQLESGWFSYWPGETTETWLRINSYVLRTLLEMKKSWSMLDEQIKKSISYLEKNFNSKNATLSENIEIYFALSKAWKKIDFNINASNLSKNELILYTYGLLLNDKNKFKSVIESNISKIIEFNSKTHNSNSYYTNAINDKAIFVQLLIDFNYNKNYIDKLISELYSVNWNSYYYSTKTKNNSFLAFAKYLDSSFNKRINKFWFSIWKKFNKNKLFNVWGSTNYIKKFEYKLSDLLLKDEKVLSLVWANYWKWPLYADIIIKEYPKDLLKVKSYSNKVELKRDIYEVLDEAKLNECSDSIRYRKYSPEMDISCDDTLKLVTDNIYKKWTLYKVILTSTFEDDSRREDFTVEDYLPWTFRVINSKFKTESSLVKQDSKNWNWGYTEYRPNVVMAHSRYIRNNKVIFEYFVRPEFKGFYIQPPFTWYMMYNPLIRWNTEFNIIEVK